MPTYNRELTVEERLAQLEASVAQIGRGGSRPDDLPLFRTNYEGLNWDDSSTITTVFENKFTPRSASLALGLLLIGDVVGTTNTGGAWQVVLNLSDIVASGTIPATNSYVLQDLVIDMSPYIAQTDLRIDVKTQRTTGASTGGRYGGGGCIGSAVRYARMN